MEIPTEESASVAIEGTYDMDVHYQPNVLEMRSESDLNATFINRLLRTKHEGWSYEQEVRMFIGLNDPPYDKGLRWINFGPSLALREVIIGSQCDSEVSKMVEGS